MNKNFSLYNCKKETKEEIAMDILLENELKARGLFSCLRIFTDVSLLASLFCFQLIEPCFVLKHGCYLQLCFTLSCSSHVRLCVTLQTAAHQAPPSLGFSRQEHWSGLPFPSPMHESENWKWSCSVVPTLSDPMDCSRPGSSIHGILPHQMLKYTMTLLYGISIGIGSETEYGTI